MITFDDLTESDDGVLGVKIGEEFFPIISEYVQVRKSTVEALVAALEESNREMLTSDGEQGGEFWERILANKAALALARGEG